MTLQEFNQEFDIYYNNISSNVAPGLDAYEKSVFLTDALEQIVRELYSTGAYEGTELTRRHLDRLKRQSVRTSPTQNTAIASSDNSYFFTIPDEVMYIVKENVKLPDGTLCDGNNIIDVLPVSEDEFNLQKRNPFRKASVKNRNRHAWRMDYSNIASDRIIEIVGPDDIEVEQYILRYIKKPDPIILVNLQTIDPSLTIEGQFNPSECELDSIVHRYILKLAVETAYRTYMAIKQSE